MWSRSWGLDSVSVTFGNGSPAASSSGMKRAAQWGILVSSLAALFCAVPVYAQTAVPAILYSPTSFDPFAVGAAYYANTATSYTSYQTLGTGLTGAVTSLVGAFSANNAAGATFRGTLYCFTDYAYTIPCTTASVTGAAATVAGGGSQVYATSTLSSVYQLQSGSYYELGYTLTSNVGVAQFMYIYGSQTDRYSSGASLQGTATGVQLGPVLDLFFQVYGYSTYTPDWSLLSVPIVYSSTSTALATSSALWGSISLASTTQQCNSGNLFSDGLCSAGVYLFVPNQQILAAFAELPQAESTHWPFSWIIAVQTAFSSQGASSTANLPTYSYDLASVDPASTTPLGPILPTFTFLSSTTVLTYISQANWNLLQALVTSLLYLLFAYDVFFTLRNRFHRV